MKAKEIMSRQVITVTAETSVRDIARLLSGHGIRAVPVVDESGRLVIGIVAEGDLVGRLRRLPVAQPLDLLTGALGLAEARELSDQIDKIAATRAKDIMTSRVITVSEDADLSEVANLLVERRINQLPVLNSRRELVGIISRADIVRAAIA
jgi:CBS domain-containing protein